MNQDGLQQAFLQDWLEAYSWDPVLQANAKSWSLLRNLKLVKYFQQNHKSYLGLRSSLMELVGWCYTWDLQNRHQTLREYSKENVLAAQKMGDPGIDPQWNNLGKELKISELQELAIKVVKNIDTYLDNLPRLWSPHSINNPDVWYLLS